MQQKLVNQKHGQSQAVDGGTAPGSPPNRKVNLVGRSGGLVSNGDNHGTLLVEVVPKPRMGIPAP